MKKILIACLLVMVGLSSQAQKFSADKLPTAVADSFKKLYPTATDTKWEKEDGNYEASFKLNSAAKEVVFYADGKLVQSEDELSSINDLPTEVRDAFTKDYSGYNYLKSEKIITDNGTITYEIDAELKKEKFAIVYDTKGIFIKKTKE
jgi:hypothetical protein